MDGAVEHEICANCKKEIPHYNYIMHTAHCARNISLCPVCKKSFPKNEIENHRKKCHRTEKVDFPRQLSKPHREEKRRQNDVIREAKLKQETTVARPEVVTRSVPIVTNPLPVLAKPKSLMACRYCDLELPKLELGDHENYCGARTDKCNECGELVMYKYKKLHEDTNHGFLKLNDEPGPRPTWDSDTQRPEEPSYARRQRPAPIYTVNSFDLSPLYNYATNYSSTSLQGENNNDEKKESYKELSRRLDCKTEYIRNLLHDSASITVPLRRNGAVPRNHFNHNKGSAPQPPQRRPNPPTELMIPCEFCDTPIPHDELIQHETGCRPDLARFNPRRRTPSPDDYYVTPEPRSPEVELPCEFCADMFPASQLLRHQNTCN